ncbi:hypothetical protein AC579_3475 [Pseudocercospora musae]|uniref:Uncharacterized protein n=1 Tax=Pseudocercospora musae TaxID=113226 RepID=A0A139IEH5_9PEZI|nr:hypothetical protein AC579_3475 [Pseudocercospora musae]
MNVNTNIKIEVEKMLRLTAAKRAFSSTSFRPTQPPVRRPLPLVPPPVPRVVLIIRPSPTGHVDSARSFGTSRRLAKLKDQGPFGDGFMDIGCKTIKVLLALVIVNTIVIPMWETENCGVVEEAERTEDEGAKVAISK